MRTSLTQAARHPAPSRDKLAPSLEWDRLMGTRTPTERPASLRDTLVRWLNEEL